MEFVGVLQPDLWSRRRQAVRRFSAEHQDIICKPLGRHGWQRDFRGALMART